MGYNQLSKLETPLNRRRAAIWIVSLSIIYGLLIWHAVWWHYRGIYSVMFSWQGTNKVYLAAFYNLGLLIATGVVSGLLLGKIVDLLGSKDKVRRIDIGQRMGIDNVDISGDS